MSLALSAIVGLMGTQANAGPITISVYLGAITPLDLVQSVSSVPPDQGVSFSIPANPALAALNIALKAHGTSYEFTSLGASSNYTGSSNGNLLTSGGLTFISTGNTSQTLYIVTTQSGFLSPTGPGGIMNSSGGINSDNVATGGTGTQYTSTYQSTNSATLTFASQGVDVSKDVSGNAPPQSIGTIPSSYSLTNTFSINLTKSVGGSLGFHGSVLVYAVPEPSSLVTMLMGMPLPLAVVFGLIRRRLSAA